ncbi:MAG: methylated-DNA--[protein]-cysteine S-methyltransferase, partial [Solirubrobacteraceae bacterium]
MTIAADVTSDARERVDELEWTIYESPLGPLTLVGDRHGLRRLHFPGRSEPLNESARGGAAFATVVAQLEEYFAGRRQSFDLALALHGTPFQQRVWAALAAIPFGATRTYGEVAAQLDAPTRRDRVRAVGAAV